MSSHKISASIMMLLIVLLGQSLAAIHQHPSSDAQSDSWNSFYTVQSKGKAIRARALPVNQLDRDQYQRSLTYLEGFVHTHDLTGLVKAADELDKRWSPQGGEYYGRLMLNISSLIANTFHEERVYSLSQKYALAGLAQADSFSLELETKLLPFIAMNLAPGMKTNNTDTEWSKERGAKAKLWLHAWQRLEKEIDRNFNFDDRPFLNIAPPVETGLPAGIAPAAIKDRRLRARYEAAISANAEKSRRYDRQSVLRSIDEHFTKQARQYLVKAYSAPPINLEELKTYLDAYLIDKSIKEGLLNEVEKSISEAQTNP